MQQTARAAVLTAPKTFEIREYPIPAIGDDEMLIKVEACGVCGTDGHEYNRDPFGLCPVVLGHEGTGEIVAMGRNITKDTAGNPVALGDKIVTCIIPCGTCDACLNTPARTNLCENVGVYGLMPDDDVHLNGYFGEYLVIRKGSTFFNVSGMTLDQRILVEPAAVVVHSLERAKSTGLLKFNSVVLVQGCGPIGLLQIATLRTLGIETIIAVDGNDSRLELAREMGASRTYNFTRYADLNELLDAVKKDNGGRLADFVFQCTGVGKAGANAWKFVKRGGGLCEVGFFMDGGESVINHHYDLCNKEVTAVGSWVYSPQDYPTTFDFLKRAYGIGLPLTKLISHRFKLDEIAEALETNVQMKGIKIAVICGSPENSSCLPMPPFFKNGGFFTPSFPVKKHSASQRLIIIPIQKTARIGRTSHSGNDFFLQPLQCIRVKNHGFARFKAQTFPVHLPFQRQIFIDDAIGIQGGVNDEMQQIISNFPDLRPLPLQWFLGIHKPGIGGRFTCPTVP